MRTKETMNKLVIVVFVVLLTIQVDSYVGINPRDLADEVQKQLDELTYIIQGQILVSHADLENNEVAFLAYSSNVKINGEISIQRERDSVFEQINIIKSLANSANKDISSCTTIRESLLQRLADEYLVQLRDCIQVVDTEATRLTAVAIYNVDISINIVYRIQFQVSSCNGNLLCLSPIVTEIALEKVLSPQNIKTEVDAATTSLNTLRLSVASCSDQNVSQFIASASSLLRDLIACANAILD